MRAFTVVWNSKLYKYAAVADYVIPSMLKLSIESFKNKRYTKMVILLLSAGLRTKR